MPGETAYQKKHLQKRAVPEESSNGLHQLSLDDMSMAHVAPPELLRFLRCADVSALGLLSIAVSLEQQARNTRGVFGEFLPDMPLERLYLELEQAEKGSRLWYAVRREISVRDAFQREEDIKNSARRFAHGG